MVERENPTRTSDFGATLHHGGLRRPVPRHEEPPARRTADAPPGQQGEAGENTIRSRDGVLGSLNLGILARRSDTGIGTYRHPGHFYFHHTQGIPPGASFCFSITFFYSHFLFFLYNLVT